MMMMIANACTSDSDCYIEHVRGAGAENEAVSGNGA